MSHPASSERTPLLQLLRSNASLRAFLIIRVLWAIASQMINVAIGWYVYEVTRSAWDLGLVGLALFLPSVFLAPVAGWAADNFDRRKILAASFALQASSALGFMTLIALSLRLVWPIFMLLLLFGTSRAFSAPSMSSLLPRLVASKDFPRAVAIGTSAFQIATIAGPSIGGLVYTISGTFMFGLASLLILAGVLLVPALRPLAQTVREVELSETVDKGFLAGIHYVRGNRLLLGAISLDMFAVLLGGVTALLPIYARDILAVGPVGLGYLRSAPGLGAAVVGLSLARWPINRRAGAVMLWCVAGYGLATIIFAVSNWVWLSIAAMVLLGCFDMVSVVIRQTLVQLATPDAMRGRVSAVNFVFIGASNQLGEFESGATAALFGTIPAATIGGIGTLIVVSLYAWLFPELRHADRLSGD